MLLAPCCVATDRAPADCVLPASWPIACVPPEPPCPAFWPVRFEFPAAADEPTLFDCSTEPSLPGLSTRTEMFVFFAPLCSAFDAAAASCSLSADWPIACVPEPPAEPCSADWLVPFAFAAVASDVDGVRLRDVAVVPVAENPDGDVRVARAVLRRHGERLRGLARICLLADRLRSAGTRARAVLRLLGRLAGDWFAFPAVALESAVFDCVTSPLLPGLSTRTEMFWFAGWLCEAPDAAPAAWPLAAAWPTASACAAGPPGGVVAVAWPALARSPRPAATTTARIRLIDPSPSRDFEEVERADAHSSWKQRDR